MSESPGRPEVEGVAAEQRRWTLARYLGGVQPGWWDVHDAGWVPSDARFMELVEVAEVASKGVPSPPEGSGRGVAGEYTEADVEAGARALYDEMPGGGAWTNCDEETRDWYRWAARAVLAAVASRAASAPPDPPTGRGCFVCGLPQSKHEGGIECPAPSSSGSPLTVDAVRADERRRIVERLRAEKDRGEWEPYWAPQAADFIEREFPSPGAVQHTREDGR